MNICYKKNDLKNGESSYKDARGGSSHIKINTNNLIYNQLIIGRNA